MSPGSADSFEGRLEIAFRGDFSFQKKCPFGFEQATNNNHGKPRNDNTSIFDAGPEARLFSHFVPPINSEIQCFSGRTPNAGLLDFKKWHQSRQKKVPKGKVS